MKMYKKIMLLDTSVGSENIGDYIIMDAVRRELRDIFPNSFFANVATHDNIGVMARKIHKSSDYTFIGGTNLLSGVYHGKNSMQWKVGFSESRYLNNAIGLGVGWSNYKSYKEVQYQPFVFLQKLLYKRLMNSKIYHSVRDSYTKNKFEKYGVKCINTACVTMWQLTHDHLINIPKNKSSAAVMTITDYCNSNEYLLAYKEMIEVVLKNYSIVFLWLQSLQDFEMLEQLNVKGAEKIKILPPNLEAYNAVLEQGVDYVGTRLHGGIRALQKGDRALIIEVDNRATEIAKDTNLPTLNYKNLNQLDHWINHSQEMDIHVPFDNIAEWKSQFE